jgi:hypothetical protein
MFQRPTLPFGFANTFIISLHALYVHSQSYQFSYIVMNRCFYLKRLPVGGPKNNLRNPSVDTKTWAILITISN